jgi:hypothetical protein
LALINVAVFAVENQLPVSRQRSVDFLHEGFIEQLQSGDVRWHFSIGSPAAEVTCQVHFAVEDFCADETKAQHL